MFYSSLRSRLFAASAIGLACLVTTPAAARDQASTEAAPNPPANVAPAGGGQVLEEVLVTAQRRSESLQKTSVAISVLSNEQLSRSGVTGAQELGSALPGLSISTATPAPQIYIRGVGDFAATTLNNPAVAINIDNVYVSRAEALPTELFDLERVEVLKGPQGTLYGRNASGGAINLITRRPKLGDFAANLNVELGNLNARTISGGVNLPVGETLAIRIAGNVVRRDGYVSSDRGDAKTEGLRVRALWEPSSKVSLLLNGAIGHVGGKGPAGVIVNGPASFGKRLDSTSSQAIAYIQSKVYPGDPATGSPDLRPLVVAPNASGAFQDMDFKSVSAELNADLDFATLTVIPAYRQADVSYTAYPFLKLNFGSAFGIFPANPETSKATSLEVRLSNATDALKWVVGGYFYDESQSSQYTVNAGPLQNIGLLSHVDTRAYAAFGQATYSLTDRFRLIGGLRYTSDRRALTDGATYALNPSFMGLAPTNPATPPGPGNPLVPVFFNPPDPNAALLVERYQGRKTFSNTSWKVGVEYDVTPEALFYATASSGFKAGGFNQQQQLGSAAGANQASFFQPEKLVAYDAGLKSRLLDNRLQLNLSAFYWDYQDQQFNRFAVGNAGNIGIIFDNAQKARIYGAAVEAVARPWQGATVTVTAEYDDAQYKKFVFQTAQSLPGVTGCATSVAQPVQIGPAGPILSIDCSGKPVARAPKWTGGAGFSQKIDLTGGGTLTFATDMTFTSGRYLTFDYVPASHVGSDRVYNASATYTPEGASFTVSAFVRNLTNTAVYNGGSEPNYAPGVFIGSVGLPRTYGVRFGVEF